MSVWLLVRGPVPQDDVRIVDFGADGIATIDEVARH
jgi:hypothetical protein